MRIRALEAPRECICPLWWCNYIGIPFLCRAFPRSIELGCGARWLKEQEVHALTPLRALYRRAGAASDRVAQLNVRTWSGA